MSDIKGFESDLRKFADSLGLGVETVVKKISLQVFTGVVKKTPVDTGRARANWVISVEVPSSAPPLPDGKTFSGQEATAFANKELVELSKIKPFSNVFISNNMPYIEVLEDGSSDQAPEGMLAVTLTEVERDIKRITDDF